MSYLDTKGRIFDIQRYSVHDGVGIRTIVFLKGCVLRCKWCCNPESQEYAIQQMRLPTGKIRTVGEDTTVRKVMEVVEQDRIFYRRSGGGLTLSGGECTLQAEFARDLLHAAKDSGFSTAIESIACCPYEKIEMLLPYLDTYLMDIKHTNPQKHKVFCGKENTQMLENIRKVAESGQTELVIRTPVIPGFNDSPEEIRSIAAFAAKLPGVRQMHILPYHRLGSDKYLGLDREYPMGEVLPPSMDKMKLLQQVAEAEGLLCMIGG